MKAVVLDYSDNSFLGAYMREILRWNASMNLISRKDTENVCFNLISQCRDAFQLFWSWYLSEYGEPGGGPALYADLGSGAGLPGVIWNQLFFGMGLRPETVLVEPREKRAWFLRRVSRIEGSRPFGVLCGRWGGDSSPGGVGAVAETAVLSLKALHLKEVSVFEGLENTLSLDAGPAAGLHRVVVVRFYPGDQELNSSLKSALGCPSLGDRLDIGRVPLIFDGCHIIGPTLGLLPASLVVTRYHRDGG